MKERYKKGQEDEEEDLNSYLNEKRRCCELKEDALYRTGWRARSESGLVLLIEQNAEWLNKQQLALSGAETWTLRDIYHKYLESFVMWCWWRIEKTIWFDGVRNELSYRGQLGPNILHRITRRKGNWIDHFLCGDCLLKHVIEGKVEGTIDMTGRQGRRREQLLD